jgi:hypothetical protein
MNAFTLGRGAMISMDGYLVGPKRHTHQLSSYPCFRTDLIRTLTTLARGITDANGCLALVTSYQVHNVPVHQRLASLSSEWSKCSQLRNREVLQVHCLQ